ncbi:MAG: hypothetical protein AB3N64_02180 [Puniceicoccaceae bacterium]
MSNGLLDYSLAASFDWETLLPVVFFVLYGIAQLLGSKKKKKGEPEEDSYQEDVDMEERARQIREEIRRKIEERKRAREGQSPQPQQPVPQQRRARYDPTLPETQQRRAPEPTPAPARPVVQPQPVSRRAPEPVMPRTSSLEQRLQEQRAILERARREQQEAKAKARQMLADVGAREQKAGTRRSVIASGNLRNDLLADLQNPSSTRKAILLREVLGTPMGLK